MEPPKRAASSEAAPRRWIRWPSFYAVPSSGMGSLADPSPDHRDVWRPSGLDRTREKVSRVPRGAAVDRLGNLVAENRGAGPIGIDGDQSAGTLASMNLGAAARS